MTKILVVGPAWVGDMVMAQTLFFALKNTDAKQRIQIDLLAPPWTAPLSARMPEISQTFSLNIKHGEWGFQKRKEMAALLQKEHYDAAIVLPNSWKSALIPFLAKIPKRTGWLGEMRFGLLNDWRILNKKRYPLMVERFVALAVPSGASMPTIMPPRLQVNEDSVTQVLAEFQLNKAAAPILALAPGAEFGPSKRWPSRHFAALADHMSQKGYQVWLFGSPHDSAVAEEIIALAKAPLVNLVGRTNLSQALDLLSCADKVVANDSGLMHIAAALNKTVIAVYGSTSPEFTPPLSTKATVIQASQSCSPCFKRMCPLQHHDCMEKLLPEKVWAELS